MTGGPREWSTAGVNRPGSADVDGDMSLVERLHADHSVALSRWVRTKVTDDRDVEEIVAETLVRAWRRWDQFDPHRGDLQAWLFGIARNVVIDRHRAAGRRLRVVDGDGDEHAVDDEVERMVEASVVQEALGRLPDHHGRVIVEAYYEGRTTREIAERLGIPPGTVKSRLHHGLRALRGLLEEQGVLR